MRRRVIVVVILMVSLVVVIYYCTPRPACMEDFELSVTVAATEILPYEPLVVTMSMRNISWRPVQGAYGFRPQLYYWRSGDKTRTNIRGLGSLAICFLGPGPILDRGRAIRWTQTVLLTDWTGQFEVKRPESGSHTVLSIGDAKPRFLFADAGEYWLKADVRIGDFGVESKPIRILVREMPPEHHAAAGIFTHPEVAFLVAQDQRFLPLGFPVSLAEEFVAVYPETVYAEHVRVALEKHRRR